MAPKGYKQEMPPPGGYQDIEWAKKVAKKKLGGIATFGLFSAFTGAMWAIYYFDRKRQRKEELEMRDARIAITPLIVAEQQRMMLKQFRANRDEENELMKDVEGWKTGTLWGEPVYNNVRDRWIWPATEEYFAHCPYWEKFNITNDGLNH
ncbi:NADH dehydrogenase [ubiquinone] 1 alpha subcomplex subunit 13-like [Babylonia areolata]|uniref:NADH dehydrogenase [ubiquinone] 1 alpha subcomplex subunit 13-like n=1 Tax=Babylonia areolata TaxID=304850 RepID=UPI003FD149F0